MLIHGLLIRLNNNMANVDVNTKLNYWIDGTSGTLIKGKITTPVGVQVYWYNGSTDGYLAGSSAKSKARYFAVLVGF